MADADPAITPPDDLSLGRLGDFVGFRLRRIQNQLSRDFMAITADEKLRSGLFSALAIIAANPGLSQITLAREVGLDKSLAVAAVDELEKRGWAVRQRSTVDRRRHALFITEAGEAFLDDLPAGGGVRPGQRQHPQDRRAHRGGRHRAARRHPARHARAPARPAMRLIDAVRRASEQLDAAQVAFGHGTTNAFDEAAWLVLWRLGLPLDELDGVAERELSADEAQRIDQLVDQRISTRKPAAYLTREAWLQGVSFYVTERAIEPRSFIAELIADASIDPWLNEDTRRVLDLCTGNGSLAVMAALAWPEVQVDAADLSRDALAVARINVDRHGLGERITLIESDGLAQVRGPYDLIVCNPPYVNAEAMSAPAAGIPAPSPRWHWRPAPTAMDFVRPADEGRAGRLKPQGVLVLEIGNEREHFERAFPRGSR